MNSQKITVEITIQANIEKVWNFWTTPEHIMQWNNASADWHTPKAINDLQNGGRFVFTMAAKDGSFSFDFEGTYSEIIPLKSIEYYIADNRKVSIDFITIGDVVEIVETFEAENENSIELQKQGWQAILNNFKNYVEAN
ncbi:SRPBCC family protein [Flavobacterium sp. SUN052]|uniref:SRPBCC family protein n=1 Tax=Flavobacterium sp. SUN052 TaxID=3002441 RepID=UPI00237D75D2|nr:SRPBCC family protein [Flavobacterium sp. SUN052]MEC4005063.1 SRPBCC family protein [Flavobacterium sp. SUN052]